MASTNKIQTTILLGVANVICPGIGFFILRKLKLAALQYVIFALIDIVRLILLPWFTSDDNTQVGWSSVLLIIWGISHLVGLIYLAIIGFGEGFELIGFRKKWLSLSFAVAFSLATQGMIEQHKNLNGYRVPAGGMEPTLQQGQKFMVNSIAYRNSAPKHGDIIIFTYPEDTSIRFVKRVVGLPGDTVELYHSELRVNGILKVEPYANYKSNAHSSVRPYEDYANFTTVVGENTFFVLGDNRYASLDSRNFGAVPFENIRGKVISTFTDFPPRFSVLHHN